VTSNGTFPDKCDDTVIGGVGTDNLMGCFGQGGDDHLYGVPSRDYINVAQRGFTDSDVKVTKEVVDCDGGEDTVRRDKGKDVLANSCEYIGPGNY
jgi:hypothetical protein